MIHSIILKDFKCFSDYRLPLGCLTVLTGTNGSGKSTVMQALLALRQSQEQGALARGQLALNGSWVHLGTGQDVLRESAEGIEVGIGLQVERDYLWHFAYSANAEELAATSVPPTIPELALFREPTSGDGATFQYLCAERIGPRTSFSLADHAVRHRRLLGAAGEYTAQYLAEFGRDVVRQELRHADAAASDLRSQTEAWLSHIVGEGSTGDLRIHVQTHRAMDVAQLQFAFSSPRIGESNRYRPTNVGFGLTYSLPVIVAVLSAGPGALLLIENPEAHLHPRGQAEIGILLARSAASGVQILVETHSDHVLNGIRRAVRSKILEAGLTSIHFFRRTVEAQEQVVSPVLDPTGNIDHWPEGFFDQFEKDMNHFAGWGD
ncbi:MAG: DUF3696 domain-containing protein [Myxococcota bacterium]|jgi:predicted ATPase|nr:DUF3696 domain-containing protein [Myxococcota bacterium]